MLAIVAVVLLSGTLASTTANATIIFEVAGSLIDPGDGYGGGIDNTALNVAFTDTAVATGEELLEVGENFSFDFGTVNFLDADRAGGGGGPAWIDTDEQEALAVTATFNFVSPEGMAYELTATGSAIAMNITDGPVDYTLSWTDFVVDFGIGGQFTIAINTLMFANNDEGAKTLTATVTLNTEPPEVVDPVDVPEPGTLVIFGIGLLGLGVMNRRRGKRRKVA